MSIIVLESRIQKFISFSSQSAPMFTWYQRQKIKLVTFLTFKLTWAFRLIGELIVYACLRRTSPVNILKYLLLRSHFANSSQISYGVSYGTYGTDGPGHMTKMAAIPIYGKNLKKSSSPEQKSRWPWNLVCSIGCSSTTKFVQMMTLGWPWPILRQGQIWSLLYGKRVNQWIFQKLLLSVMLQLVDAVK